MYIKAYRTVYIDDQTPTTTELVTFRNIMRISFDPEVNVTGSSIPVNEFEADIQTGYEIPIGNNAELYDDNDNLWAKYWIVSSYQLDLKTVRIRARSHIFVLDRVNLKAVYYNGETLSNVLAETITTNSVSTSPSFTIPYSVDSSFDGVTITGFCPEQTSRQRLTWICFAIGAYAKAFFNDRIEILPIDRQDTFIPMEKTYWKPDITYNDWVTAIRIKYYSFVQGEPQSGEQYVEDADGVKYIVTETQEELLNNNAPVDAPENAIEINGIYLVNLSNVYAIFQRIADYYFIPTEVNADVIDNAEYIPGDSICLCANEKTMMRGIVERAEFSFGTQAKASLTLIAGEKAAAATLVVRRMFGDIQVDKALFFMPVGFTYSVDNPHLDVSLNGHRYILRPLSATATGTIQNGENEVTVNYEAALDLYEGTLSIYSVDDATKDGKTVVIV